MGGKGGKRRRAEAHQAALKAAGLKKPSALDATSKSARPISTPMGGMNPSKKHPGQPGEPSWKE